MAPRSSGFPCLAALLDTFYLTHQWYLIKYKHKTQKSKIMKNIFHFNRVPARVLDNRIRQPSLCLPIFNSTGGYVWSCASKKNFVLLRYSPTVIWWHGTKVYKYEWDTLDWNDRWTDIREVARTHCPGLFNDAEYRHGGIIIECPGCLPGDYTESAALFRKFSTSRRSLQRCYDTSILVFGNWHVTKNGR